MKRLVKGSSELTNYSNYRCGGYPFTYGIHDNGSDNPDNYKAQIVEHHPYSEAEYVWARIGYKGSMSVEYKGSMSVEYIQSGKVIDCEPGYGKNVNSDWQDFFESADEYIREMVEQVCDELKNYNKNVESVIGYD